MTFKWGVVLGAWDYRAREVAGIVREIDGVPACLDVGVMVLVVQRPPTWKMVVDPGGLRLLVSLELVAHPHSQRGKSPPHVGVLIRPVHLLGLICVLGCFGGWADGHFVARRR
jgi:hypothetical protein